MSLKQMQILDGAVAVKPEQEPVAWPHKYGCRANAFGKCDMGCTTPPQRKPLTDEVIWLEYQRFWPFHPAEEPTLAKDIVKFARAIEAAHGIWPENSDCHGPDWTDRDGEYLK